MNTEPFSFFNPQFTHPVRAAYPGKEEHMKQIIADKLNFLMKVTGTKNNMLSRALNFDASHISRIRSGQRGLPSHREFIVPAAAYFARAVRNATQKRVLSHRICPGVRWPESLEGATAMIAGWLGEDEPIDFVLLNRYLEENQQGITPVDSEADAASRNNTEFYPGNEGKRQCVMCFLTELAALEEPVTLLLNSEENMEWLYEKPEFAKQWAALLVALLERGSRIVIVHTISRSFGEMVEAVAKWAPLYAIGHIEPYYYPRLRDHVFRRTLFIAKGKLAVVSHSTGDAGVNRLNMLTRDPVAVAALEQEFSDFLAMCSPLMQVFTADNFRAKILPVLTVFRKTGRDLLQFHVTPSLLTLPEEVAASLSRRPGCEEFGEFLSTHNRRLFMRGKVLANHVTDILVLPDIVDVMEEKVALPLSDLIGLPPLFYKSEEYLAHLTSALQWMKTSNAYRVVPLTPDMSQPINGKLNSQTFSIVASLQAGVMLHSNQTPTALFYTREPAMTSSFCEYLNRFIINAAPPEEAAARLQQYIDKLKIAIEMKNGEA